VLACGHAYRPPPTARSLDPGAYFGRPLAGVTGFAVPPGLALARGVNSDNSGAVAPPH